MSKTMNWCRKKGSCPDTFFKVMLYVLISTFTIYSFVKTKIQENLAINRS